jgi:hypothetical protein
MSSTGDGVDARERLVEQDEARASWRARARSRSAALAAGQRNRRRIREMRDRQVLEQCIEAIAQRVGIEVLQLEDRAHVLGDGQLAEDRRFLRQVRQPRRARWWIGRRDRFSPSSSILPPSAATRPTIM